MSIFGVGIEADSRLNIGVNFRLFSRVLGLLLMLESLALFACALFGGFDAGMGDSATIALGVAALSALLSGATLAFLGRGKYDRIPRREAVLIVGAGWLLSGVIGSVPFILSDPGLPVGAAFFESVSGLTTTGSTVIADLSQWPRSILLWRALSQWFGGLGILVLFVALLSSLGAGTKSLFRNESSFEASEASHAKIRDTAVLLWRIYLLFTVVCMSGLKALGMTWFDAICHGFTCVSTGGFSTHNESISFFSNWETGLAIELWLILFMLLGSFSFLLYAVLLRRNFARLKRDEELKWYLTLITLAIGCVVAVNVVVGGHEVGAALRGGVFTVISIISSTGYGTMDFEQWPVVTHFIILGLMFVGGCSGSTSGGFKVSRLILILRSVYQEIVQAFRPHQVFRMQVNGNSINDQSRAQTVLFACLYLFIIFASTIVVSLLEVASEADFDTIASSVFATLSNMGPGLGDIGPTNNFSNFREPTLIYLGLLMVMGRLELFAFLVLFVPAAWKKY